MPKLDSCLTRRKLKDTVLYVRGYLKITSRIINKSVCFKSKRLKFPSPLLSLCGLASQCADSASSDGSAAVHGTLLALSFGMFLRDIFLPRMKEKSVRSMQQKVAIDLRSC